MKFIDNSLIWGKQEQFLLHGYNDWAQIFGEWNWLTFTLIRIDFERDYMAPGWDFEFIILGLGFGFRVNDDWEQSENGRKLLKRIRDIEQIEL